MSQATLRHANQLLGYPDDARLLIINADDFGMCHAVNAAITRSLTAGVVTSTTVMVPCAWALHAMQWLAAHADIPFGVHLTVVGDSLHDRWKPISSRDYVSSLVDETAHFYNWDRMDEFLARARLDQLEVEFRAQIETVLAAGLMPTHLDWHSIRIYRRPEILDVMFGLAKEYGLALRARERPLIDNVQRPGCNITCRPGVLRSTCGTMDSWAAHTRCISGRVYPPSKHLNNHSCSSLLYQLRKSPAYQIVPKGETEACFLPLR